MSEFRESLNNSFLLVGQRSWGAISASSLRQAPFVKLRVRSSSGSGLVQVGEQRRTDLLCEGATATPRVWYNQSFYSEVKTDRIYEGAL